MEGPARLTREELYQRVWETPMQQLASEFGMSGRGLAKICARFEIPVPPRGYWARKAAGQKLPQPKLKKPKVPVPEQIRIYPTQEREPPPEAPPEIVQHARTVSSRASLTVPAHVRNPHPIVQQWINRHHEWNRVFSSRRTREELSALEQRRHRILHVLFKALEREGASVFEQDRLLVARFRSVAIEFEMSEKIRQYRRELTSEERKSTGLYGYPATQKWRQIKEPTGKFLFRIKSYHLDGLQTEWLETDETSMEAMLPNILGTLVAGAKLLEEKEIARREEERRRSEQEAERREQARRRKRDKNQWRRFVDLAERQEKADRARAFLARLKALEFDVERMFDGRSIEDWIAWAEAYLAEYDMLANGVEGVFENISYVSADTYPD